MELIAIGEYVTLDDIKSHLFPKWIVLADLTRNDGGNVIGGVVQYIGETKTKAGDKAVSLEKKGIKTLVTRGSVDEIDVGGVFVK
jgi:hypothetical protein